MENKTMSYPNYGLDEEDVEAQSMLENSLNDLKRMLSKENK